MNGLNVKKKIQSCGISLKDVAKAMNETPQNLQSMLKVDDIKTGVLERIAKAIEKDIFFFFSDSNKENDAINNLKVINEIVKNERDIYILYQKNVDVNILLDEQLGVANSESYGSDALPYLHKYARMFYNDNINLNELSYDEKVKYSIELNKAKKNLYDIFFACFRLLYIGLRSKYDPKNFRIDFNVEYESMLKKISNIKDNNEEK